MQRSRRRGRIGGLRAQLLVGLVVLLLITLALVALATSQFHKRQLQQTVANETHRHAQWLSAIDDERQRAEAAQILERQPSILYAGPTTEDAEAIVDESSRIWIADYNKKPAMWAAANGSSPVLVVVSLADAQSAIDAGRQALLLYLLITLLFVTLVGYAFFSFIIIRPLRALSVATKRASSGDLASPVTIKPRNEFGDVARQFNQMLETLDTQRLELQEQLQEIESAHRELKQTQQSLIRSEKMASVGHLAAGIAHEVGNPLSAVMGYTELLRDRDVDAETADDIAERTLVQLKRIRQIIRQLLDYSRTETETTPQPVDIAEVVDESVHLVQATPEAQNIAIDVDVDADLPPAYAVAGELEQVVVNLLLNAVRSLDDHPSSTAQIAIEARLDEDNLRIDLQDTGPGIDAAIADRIFEPFFTTREPGEGTGLGLAIAQRLVARVGGDLQLVSADDGAHFRILLRPHHSKTSESASDSNTDRSSINK